MKQEGSGRNCFGIAALFSAVCAASVPAEDITWVKRKPAHWPGNNGGDAMVFDSARSVCVFAVGQHIDEKMPTWEWDGEDWTLAYLGPNPNSDKLHGMAYDSWRGVTVMFGGLFAVNALDETWEWDGVAWTRRYEPGPPAAIAPMMAFDSKRGVSVVYCPKDDLSSGDTWEWDGAEWSLRDTVGPTPRAQSVMCYDPLRGACVLHGGSGHLGKTFTDTWEWDGQTWTMRSDEGPPPRRAMAMVFDSLRGSCIFFGGETGEKYFADTWEWDGCIWTELHPAVAPPARSYHAMAYDPLRQVTVLFGGLGDFGGSYKDTWELHLPRKYIPDCDGSGELDLFDFLCFVNLFNDGEDTADCDGNGVLDLFDFLCFVNAFNEGC